MTVRLCGKANGSRSTVVVNSVNGDIISGDGEWDPPDGWAPFEVSLATGRVLKGPQVTHYPLESDAS